jgi:NAD-dependent dihydropyrimidine dehydrogenase PreA subunit
MDIFAIDEETKKPKVEYGYECWHCGVCWMECPVRAIDVTLPCSMW